MKQITLCLLFFLFAFTSKAQDFLPFPDSNATWVTGHHIWENPMVPPLEMVVNHIDRYCTTGRDSIIDGESYIVLTDCSSGIVGFIRDSSGTQYFIEAGETTEYILCDFNAETGDTLYNTYPEGIEYFVVGDKYTIEAEGVTRRVTQIGDGEWIEGIGFSHGLLTLPFPSVSGGSTWSLCMSYNDTIRYEEEVLVKEPGECHYYLSAPELEETTPLTIYPNPSTGIFTISSDETVMDNDLMIFNVLGEQIIIAPQQNGNQMTIDLSNQPNGVYYLIHTQNAIRQRHRLIKIN